MSDVSVSGESVGERIGGGPTLTSAMSGCSLPGCGSFFALGCLWPGSDSSPVPGASFLGSLGDGGRGGAGRAAVNVCALSLVGGGWLLSWVATPVSACLGAGGTVVSSGFRSGWLAFSRLSARVRCPKVAMTACSSM